MKSDFSWKKKPFGSCSSFKYKKQENSSQILSLFDGCDGCRSGGGGDGSGVVRVVLRRLCVGSYPVVVAPSCVLLAIFHGSDSS